MNDLTYPLLLGWLFHSKWFTGKLQYKLYVGARATQWTEITNFSGMCTNNDIECYFH